MKKNLDLYWDNLIVNILELIPLLIIGFFIILLGYLIALLIKKISKKLILRIGNELNNWINIGETRVNLNDLATFTSRASFWVVMLITFSLFIQLFELKIVNDFFEQTKSFVPKLVLAVAIILGGIVAGRLLSKLLESYSQTRGISKSNFFSTGIRYFVVFIAFVVASDQLGIHVDFLTDLIDIVLAMLLFGVSLSFGLGSKESVSNILASFDLKKDFSLGNKIAYKDIIGRIVKLSSNSIHIQTTEGIVVIPAKAFREGVVIILKEESDEE